MVYDALAESVRLLHGEAPADDAHLSRRVRHVPLAVHRDGDLAATLFLRRGVSGAPEMDAHVLELTDDGWRVLGGGSGPGDEATGPRPRQRDAGAPGLSRSGGGVARAGGTRRLGWGPGQWVSWAELRLATEVASLLVGGRASAVAGHGTAVVVWTGRPPRVTALDADGRDLGQVPISDVALSR